MLSLFYILYFFTEFKVTTQGNKKKKSKFKLKTKTKEDFPPNYMIIKVRDFQILFIPPETCDKAHEF